MTAFHTPESRLVVDSVFLSVLRDSPCAVVETDLEGNVLLWNSHAAEIFGIPAERVLGRRLPIRASDRVQVPTAPDRSHPNPLVSPDRREFETELLDLEGRPIAVSIWHGVLRSAEGDDVGHVSIVSDRREQNALQQALLESVELESRRLGRELHDSLSQQLLGAAFAAKSLANKAERQGLDLTSELDDLAALINDAVRETRLLSQGLNPIDLDPSGLESALTNLAERHSSRVNCNFVCRKTVLISDRMTAMHVYRIAHEAVSALVEHEDVSNLAINLTESGDRVSLRISHDGVSGFDADDFPAQSAIHFRVNALRGDLAFHNDELDGGHSVEIQFSKF